MGNVCINSTGSGAGSDECTAVANDVAIGVTAIVNGSDDEPVEGTLQFTGDAQPTDVFPLKTFYNNDLHQKRIGTLGVDNTDTFTLTNYATGQVLISYALPAAGSNWTGKRICMKTGNYPENINDGFLVDNKIGAYIKTGLTVGTTYYFKCWDYLDTSAGRIYSDMTTQKAYYAPNNAGSKSFGSTQSWTVPTGVRSVRVYAVGGGGGAGGRFVAGMNKGNSWHGGGGGGGGYISDNTVAVTPGETLSVIIGGGGVGGVNGVYSQYWGTTDYSSGGGRGGTSGLYRGGSALVAAGGGYGGNAGSAFNSHSGWDGYADGGGGTGGGATGTGASIREESSWANAKSYNKYITYAGNGGNGGYCNINGAYYGGGGGANFYIVNNGLDASSNGAGNGSNNTGGGGRCTAGYSGVVILVWS